MIKQIIPIILLSLATVAFILRFIVCDAWVTLCDITAFVMSTASAIVSIVLSIYGEKRIEKEFEKRPIMEAMTKDDIDESIKRAEKN